ncbi:site-2 protease family protein [uncultured Jatrophihabitans sp.]|uniref:site-2 protease family protein n=1 Tax=uncultured Jatrophihabitans sp. TaxID=1610747 RepID=UPI0035CB6BA7
MSVYDLGSFKGGRPRRGRAVRPSPLFLAVLAITAAGGLLAWFTDGVGSRLGDFGVCVLVLGGWITSVCLHEFAHAYAAYRAGDRAVETRGYLTLNPFKYTHPVLSIFLPVVAILAGGFGLPGGAVYLHRHQFRSRAMLSLAAAVGPAVNLVLALVLGLVARAHSASVGQLFTGGSDSHARFWAGLAFLAFLQATAAVLNLLPVPGLDGYSIIEPYLDPQTQAVGEKVKPWGLLGVLVLLYAAQPIRDEFIDLVYKLYRVLGGDSRLSEFGYAFFRFWAKQPF